MPFMMPVPQMRPPVVPAIPRGGNNIDPMVVPPYGLPPDPNTYTPDAMQQNMAMPFSEAAYRGGVDPRMQQIARLLMAQ